MDRTPRRQGRIFNNRLSCPVSSLGVLGLSGGRITFIYHYFPAILFTILMMGYVIHLLLTKFPKSKIAITVYLVIAIACFFVFYPVVSGFPVSREYGMHLRLLKDWILVL